MTLHGISEQRKDGVTEGPARARQLAGIASHHKGRDTLLMRVWLYLFVKKLPLPSSVLGHAPGSCRQLPKYIPGLRTQFTQNREGRGYC